MRLKHRSRNLPLTCGCLFLLTLFLASCQEERKETPTKGHATVIVSESVAPLMKAEKDTFEELGS
jgi:hypothetical protein